MGKSIQPARTASNVSTLDVQIPPGTSRERILAQVATSATLPSASVIAQYSTPMLGASSVTELVTQLKSNACQVNGGDLSQVEATLSSQAAALNTMFAMLAGRAGENMGKYTGVAETYLKLALRAQNQCRATLETLATIKNPPVVFAKQANIAHGPQQVNNNAARSLTRARQIEKPQTKLMETRHVQPWVDAGAARKAGAGDQTMATVEAGHRPAQRRRKGHGEP